MQVQIAIGENHRFELREALLVYHGNQATFITKHEVLKQAERSTCSWTGATAHRGIRRVARPLSWRRNCCQVLPENILAKTDRMIAWWTPAQRRQMFYQPSEGKAADLNGRIFPQPPLVWQVADGQLKSRALN